jgi:peptidoglycan/xylan/chitin deacetylase (PgdA/CDA1 family)
MLYNRTMPSLTRRDFLKVTGVGLTAVALPRAGLVPPPSPVPVIYHGDRALPRIALTFDDCWHPEALRQLTGLLEPYPGYHLTFFAIGDAIEIDETLQPGLWKTIHDGGHEIGYHTYHHYDPQVMSTSSLIADFDSWMKLLRTTIGIEPPVRFARPPYDDLSLSFQELCRERGLVATLYSAGFEATTMDDSMLLVSRTENGDIVQMHTYQDPPKGRSDVEITAKAVPYLANKGFALVTMSELYRDVLRDAVNSAGCDIGTGASPTRTCLD